mgnify:CR=1 FL=1
MPRERIPAMPARRDATRVKRNRKLIVLLFLFFITILMILFFNSTLSKVTIIEITGNRYVPKAEIEAVLDVKTDDQFFLVRTDEVERNILNLKEIKSVEVVKTFPGKVTVKVEEHPAVGIRFDGNQEAYVVLANGTGIRLEKGSIPPHLPILSGWDESDPNWLELCEVLAGIPAPSLADVSEILPYPSWSYPDRVKMYTRSRYEIITAIQYMEEMIPLLDNVVLQLKQDHNGPGTITMLETITYSSFDSDKSEEEIREEPAQ